MAVSTPIVLAAATCRNPVLPVSGVTRPRLMVRLADDDVAVAMTTNNVTTCVSKYAMFSSHVTCSTCQYNKRRNFEYKSMEVSLRIRTIAVAYNVAPRKSITFFKAGFGGPGRGLAPGTPRKHNDTP